MHSILRKGLKGLHRTAGRILPAGMLARSYPGVPGRIHVDDLMLRDDSDFGLDWYVKGGRDALRNIGESLLLAGSDFADLNTCLDLPCGYGRVLRHLVAKVPPTRITACDRDRQAVRFCAAEFGVRPLFCGREPKAIAFPRAYDLIYVGSLLTHLPEVDGTNLLEVIVNVLVPGGVLVFTTQGPSCVDNLEWYGPEFVEARAVYPEELERRGVCFIPYRHKFAASRQSPTDQRYGITLHSATYIERMMQGLRPQVSLVRYAERGWEDHQDVWAYQRLT